MGRQLLNGGRGCCCGHRTTQKMQGECAMRQKASECAKCQHWWSWIPPDDPREQCAKGHRPRFYAARVMIVYGSTYKSVPAGYRRLCEDFEPREEGK